MYLQTEAGPFSWSCTVAAANQLGFTRQIEGVRLVFGKSAHDEDEAQRLLHHVPIEDVLLTRTGGPPRIVER
jgi:hypothetical protein